MREYYQSVAAGNAMAIPRKISVSKTKKLNK